jgi:hypothetical protein
MEQIKEVGSQHMVCLDDIPTVVTLLNVLQKRNYISIIDNDTRSAHKIALAISS